MLPSYDGHVMNMNYLLFAFHILITNMENSVNPVKILSMEKTKETNALWDHFGKTWSHAFPLRNIHKRRFLVKGLYLKQVKKVKTKPISTATKSCLPKLLINFRWFLRRIKGNMMLAQTNDFLLNSYFRFMFSVSLTSQISLWFLTLIKYKFLKHPFHETDGKSNAFFLSIFAFPETLLTGKYWVNVWPPKSYLFNLLGLIFRPTFPPNLSL